MDSEYIEMNREKFIHSIKDLNINPIILIGVNEQRKSFEIVSYISDEQQIEILKKIIENYNKGRKIKINVNIKL